MRSLILLLISSIVVFNANAQDPSYKILLHDNRYQLSEIIELTEVFPIIPGPEISEKVGVGYIDTNSEGESFIPTSEYLLKVSSNYNIEPIPWAEIDAQFVRDTPTKLTVDSSDNIIFAYDDVQYLYKINENFPRPLRLPTGLNNPDTLFTSDSGAIYAGDLLSKELVQIQNNMSTIFDFTLDPESTWGSHFAPSNDSGIIVYDRIVNKLALSDDRGSFFKFITPHLVEDEYRSVTTGIIHLQSGDFALIGYDSIFFLDQDGQKVSVMDLSEYEIGGVPAISYDRERDIIIFYDRAFKRLLFFTPQADDDQIQNELARLQSELSLNPGNIRALEQKARIHEDQGSVAVALIYWKKIRDFDMFHADAVSRIDELEEQLYRIYLEDVLERMVNTFEILGPENAALDRQSIEAFIEQSIARYGNTSWLEEAQDTMNRMFGSREIVVDDGSLEVSEFSLPQIFPSLLNYYSKTPVFEFTLRNNSQKDVFIESISLSIPRFSDAPTETTLNVQLTAQNSMKLNSHLVLSPSIQEITAPIPTIATVEMHYQNDGENFVYTKRLVTQIQGINALTWDDTRKLASFITPSNPAIQNLASELIRNKVDYMYSDNFSRAHSIFEGVGLFDIAYVPDPRSPIEQVFGQASIIDSVKFPLTTLSQRTGDCDDTTALIITLFESVGIPTALVTTPGHIFFAFDTGISAADAWLFESPGYKSIEHSGKLWIPLESTNSHNGFLAAWNHASTLVEQYIDSQQIEFIPSIEAQTVFQSSANFENHPLGWRILETEISDRISDSRGNLISNVAQKSIELILDDASRQRSPRRAAMAYIRAAKLAAMLGEFHQSRSHIEKALIEDDQYLSAYAILAQIELATNNLESAFEVLNTALDLRPDSELLLALLVQANQISGNIGQYQDVLQRVSDETLRKLGISTGAELTRASESGPLIQFVLIEDL